jgi:hypothetical protein
MEEEDGMVLISFVPITYIGYLFVEIRRGTCI